MRKKARSKKKRETILIVVLAIILAAMVYYRFVEMTVTANMEKAQESIDANQAEYDISNAKLLQLKTMDQKLTDYESTGTGYLASYNNVKKEIQMLDRILAPTSDYSMSLSDAVQTGDLIRRDIAIQFTARNFAQTHNILKQFDKSEFRNIVRDITYATSTSRDGTTTVGVNMNVTFYETIVGGKADAGLVIEQQIEAPEEEGAEGEEIE